MQTQRTFGDQLREWRQRRHLSQLALAGEVNMSTRHLSFVETGRSQPSRAMVLRLADRLNVPLRERNALLTAAGYAPMYAIRPLSAPEMSAARAAVDLILTAHEPYPALLVDRYWNVVGANRTVTPFLIGLDESLLAQPMNALRLTLHPRGLRPRIENLAEWETHLLARVSRDLDLTGDPMLAELLQELRSYGDHGAGSPAHDGAELAPGGIMVPMRLRTDAGVMSMFSTTTVFGTAVEITLSELVLEAFYPADVATAEALKKMAGAL